MSFKTYKWSFIERLTVQFLQLMIIIIISRFVTPSQFGLFGLSAVVISISQVFVDSGFSAALIRKKNQNQSELSSVFYINIVIALVCIAIIFIFSPFAELYFNVLGLSELARVASIVVLINAIAVVPKVILTTNLDFKSQASASLIAVLLSGVVSVTMAIHGYGAMALVAQIVSYNLVNTALLLFKSRWRPYLIFDSKAIRELSNFSLKLLFSGLIDALYQNLYVVFIGRFMSVYDVGIFTQGKRLSDIPALTITNALQRANLASMSRLSEESKLKDYTIKSLKMSMFLMAPAMFLLSCIAEPLIHLMMGDKWIASGMIMTILSISGVFYPLHVLNQNILIIKGHSGYHLKLEILKKILGLSLIIITIQHGLLWLCMGIFVHALLSVFINAHYTKSLIDISIVAQMKLCMAPVLLSLAAASLSLYFQHLPFSFDESRLNNVKDILVSVAAFAWVFSLAVIIFYRKSISTVLNKLTKA
ncbi:TPA: lipopolysaccharide biosynthesis protein [Enterobacter hormaechei]|uniref:lipopolysaccharide biosynthesis protein n=1 Tax=Enterobacter hormaechei TaxID=158836 RepID=UPI0027ED306F|nr:lipopolysaccharide biosynthesis protein [Enterobacter hormaechei]EKY3903192.1 lipopolysaccharide biosynthesis protein [Enterobacter hormaechei]MDR9984299.1 lipopolysaccharide biosynthesis protein [Enterobacter hormaechei subsp. steigerwaltii]HBL6077715.1 lipopolysaccharide biosynthesis protein [Enterobacter hormaechei]HBL8959201.1 lipopolysaccharide biosynthesis protein [Enterobacter hormaechei]